MPFTGADSFHYCCDLLCEAISFHFPVHARRRRLPRHTRVSPAAVMPLSFFCCNLLHAMDWYLTPYIFTSYISFHFSVHARRRSSSATRPSVLILPLLLLLGADYFPIHGHLCRPYSHRRMNDKPVVVPFVCAWSVQPSSTYLDHRRP